MMAGLLAFVLPLLAAAGPGDAKLDPAYVDRLEGLANRDVAGDR